MARHLFKLGVVFSLTEVSLEITEMKTECLVTQMGQD